MRRKRRSPGGAVRRLFLLACLLCGCAASTAPLDFSAVAEDGGAPVVGTPLTECDTVCLRPGDCALAYNDDGICPAGFLCARSFACGRDAAP
jgi:hypothetical protein